MTEDARCLIVQPVHQVGLEVLQRAGITPVLCPDPSRETVLRLIPGCSAVITRDAGLSADAIIAAGKLEVIAVHGVGHDPVDKSAAAKAGAVICTTPGTNARSVAELALGLALSLARHIPAANQAVLCGTSDFRDHGSFTELHGKTALIVGWGHIGRLTGAMLSGGLGMEVLAYSPRIADIQGVRKIDDLDAGLAEAALVSLHTPLRPETAGMFDASAFASMRPGTFFVNTARAGLIDEAALVGALEDGTVAGAALDVFSPGAPSGPLGRDPRVILTPHLGGTTEEALARTARAAAENVIAALKGNLPDTALRPEEYRA